VRGRPSRGNFLRSTMLPSKCLIGSFAFSSHLYSDEGPPIGDVAPESWADAAFKIADWVLRWN
jgi:hypothetical protein